MLPIVYKYKPFALRTRGRGTLENTRRNLPFDQVKRIGLYLAGNKIIQLPHAKTI